MSTSTIKVAKEPKFEKFGKLPGRPSELILLAVNDLASVEKLTDKFKIDMGKWVENDLKNGKCSVCFAGSVMACTLKNVPEIKHVLNGKLSSGETPRRYDYETDEEITDTETTVSVDPTDMYSDESAALEALNNFREGQIGEGFDDLGLQLPDNIQSQVRVVRYSKRNSEKFKGQMRDIAKQLKKLGY